MKFWEYRASTDSVPLWALPYVAAAGEDKLKFVWPDNGGDRSLQFGDCLVEMPDGDVSLYPSMQFNRLFDVCLEDGSRVGKTDGR